MQDLGYELRRIPILRRWLNKAISCPRKLVAILLLLRTGPPKLLSHRKPRKNVRTSLTRSSGSPACRAPSFLSPERTRRAGLRRWGSAGYLAKIAAILSRHCSIPALDRSRACSVV